MEGSHKAKKKRLSLKHSRGYIPLTHYIQKRKMWCPSHVLLKCHLHRLYTAGSSRNLFLKKELKLYLQGLTYFPGGSDSKSSACDAGDLGLIPGSGMATHSINLAWKISWTEEPDGLQSVRSQKVRHD